MKLRVILNPRAASGGAGRKLPALRRALASHNLAAEIIETEAPGDAGRMARQALDDGVEAIAVVGGDGTLNEASQGYLDSEGQPREGPKLAMIPVGTGGDFRKTFDIPNDIPSAVARLAAGRTRRIDLGLLQLTNEQGQLEHKSFLNITSFGVGGLVDRMVNRGPKWLGGKAAFFLGTSRALVAYRNQPVVVKVDGERWLEGPILNVAIANGQYFGGGMHIAPQADPSDGLFDLVALGDLSPTQNMALTPHIYRGTHLGRTGISYRRGRVIETEAVFPWAEVLIDMDGETPGRLPLRAEIAPGAIELIC